MTSPHPRDVIKRGSAELRDGVDAATLRQHEERNAVAFPKPVRELLELTTGFAAGDLGIDFTGSIEAWPSLTMSLEGFARGTLLAIGDRGTELFLVEATAQAWGPIWRLRSAFPHPTYVCATLAEFIELGLDELNPGRRRLLRDPRSPDDTMLVQPGEVAADVPAGWRVVDLRKPGFHNVDIATGSRRVGTELVYVMPPEKGVGIMLWVFLVAVLLAPYMLLNLVLDRVLWTVVLGTVFWAAIGWWARKLFR